MMKDGKKTDKYGTQRWYQNGVLHRDNGPAIIWVSGTEVWYQNGNRHRDSAPAVVYPDGTEFWFQNGEKHRYDGPALVYPDGDEFWFHHDTRLSEDEIQEIQRSLEADSWFREMLTS